MSLGKISHEYKLKPKAGGNYLTVKELKRKLEKADDEMRIIMQVDENGIGEYADIDGAFAVMFGTLVLFPRMETKNSITEFSGLEKGIKI